ncbi:phage tail tape measure protein [Glutamicibacter protophormiae]|uniref:phage tail tape measure protein n=1 Tax=Glutamicibacter protophormiae TaxID=37930 RepID=UPI003A915B79
MADQSLVVRVRAEIGAFKRDMEAVVQSAKRAGEESEKAGKKSSKAGKEYEAAGKQAESGIGRMAQTAQKHQQAWDSVSTTLMVGGAAVAGGLALSTKAAISWESAFAGVKKTVDDSPAGYRQLSDELRGLARTLPATHTEIAGVAEAAGQLGVARKDITGFTKTMIDLGESTNLTAEEAATNIAQISNVMGTMEREGSKGVQRFGSALVALGNDGASTEAEILSMSQRIAGAGATIGASEADVLALSNTLASMGVKAELGGGVTTRVLLKMRTAVDEGGESLQSFAKVAGVSADEFANKFRTAPMEALDLVSKGINRVNEAGGNVTATLKDMGIKGTEETQVMLALANSGELLADSLKLGAQAWDENLALVAEAEQRYNTTESKIRIAWNNIKDAGISAGAALLPAVSGVSDVVAKLAGAFSDLPGPVQGFVTSLAGIAGVSALAVGGSMKIVGALGDMVPKLQALGMDTPRATRALSFFAKTLGGITVVGAGLIAGKIAIEGINDAVRSGKPAVEDYFNILATGGGTKLADALKFDPGNDFTGVKQLENIRTEAGVAQRAIEQLSSMNDALLGGWFAKNLTVGDTRKHVDEALELEKALQSVARAFEMGEAELGIEALSAFATQMKLDNDMVAEMINNIPELKSALTQLATDNGIQIDPNNELGLVDVALGRIKGSAPAATKGLTGTNAALDGLGAEAEEVAASLDDILASIFELGRDSRSVGEAQDALTGSLNALNESVAENGKKFTGNSEAALKNRDALRAVANDMETVVEAQARAGASSGEIQSAMQGTYDSLMEATGGSEELVRTLMSIPAGVSVKTWMEETAREIAEGTADAIEAIPGYTKVGIAVSEDGTAGQVQSRIDSVTGKTEHIFVTEDGTVSQVQAGIASIKGKDVPVWVGDDGTVYSTQGKIEGIKGKNVTIFADAETRDAYSKLSALERDRYVTIHTRVVTTNVTYETTGRGGRGGITRASGGSVFGPGSETSDSIPAMLSNNEHVWSAREVRGAGGHGQIERMRAMARAGALPAFAIGGRVGWSEDQERFAKRDRDAAKRELDRAKRTKDEKRKTRAQKAYDAAQDEYQDARDRTQRLRENVFDTRRDLKRGSIVDSFISGSGLSVVDQMFEQSKNKDLSKTQRSRLRSTAYGMESQLIGLEKRSEKLTAQLDKATEARDRLLDAKNSAASGLRSEWSLESVMQWDTLKSGPLTAGDIKTQARAKVSQYKTFAKKIDDLRKKGYSAAVIQDVIELGVNEGTYAADALLGGSRSDMKDINNAYVQMDKYTDSTGKYLTEAMSKGGINAADALVKGLESKQKNVDAAFYKLGKQAEGAFKRALGIKSPSRVFMGAAKDTIDGGVAGIEQHKHRLFGAYEDLGHGVANAYRPSALRTALMPSSVMSNAASDTKVGPSISVVNYYPVAESTSKTVERASQLLQL